ncbi:CopD family protein [Streptomyces indicus]|uniref:Putative copper export protein n=1 Tax=Streptomyces indicus TaxID=417292 RepID=A0A1G9FAT7_9ACTN|nr:CopD family protein [Streptomyces indicus]SDK85532.1 Putative copper export protein [Streptomyces indicus]
MTVSRPSVAAAPAEEADGSRGADAPSAAERRSALRRGGAVLVLLLLAALVPLLGPDLALYETGEADAPGIGLVTLLRTVMFGALCVLAGHAADGWLTRRVPGAPAPRPANWSLAAAGLGAVAAVWLALIVANGNIPPDSLAELRPGRLWQTTDGRLALLEVNAFIAAGYCAQSRRPGSAFLPLAVMAAAEALRAHPAIGPEEDPLVGSALTLVHLTSAALWAGGLLWVLRTLRLWRPWPAQSAALLGLYARVAAVLFAAITASGICSTLRKLPLDSLFTSAYGRVLVAKLLLVLVIAGLAVAARARLRRGAWAAIAPARAEVVVLGLAVAVSALLTAVPAPIWWDTPLWG